MTSAPARTTSRTLARTASPPSHTAPGIPGQVTPHGPTPPPLGSQASPWPPVIESMVMEICMRGPTSTPSSIALRIPASAPLASRTVVMPSASVFRRASGTR